MDTCTYDVVGNQGHEYDVIKKVKTPPTKTGGGGREEFNLSKCAAYGPVSTPSAPQGEGRGDQNIDYEVVASASRVNRSYLL